MTDLAVDRMDDGAVRPAYDESWSDLKKLEWWAAVKTFDTGLKVTVSNRRAGRTRRGKFRADPSLFSFSYPGASEGTYYFSAATAWLQGFDAGATSMRAKQNDR